MMTASVCAKVNLWLAVHSRRPDGLHDIETVFHSIDLTDDISMSETASDDIVVEMRFLSSRAPDVADNLAARAANAYKAATGLSIGLHLEIVKRIPISAGLGGGSADAAAVLKLLADRYGDPRTRSLQDVAADVGSDVPFFLDGGTAIGTGKGERLRPLTAPLPMSFVLACADDGLTTGEVYERWDRMPASSPPSSDVMVRALVDGGPEAVAAALHNDLERPAFDVRPELRNGKQLLLRAGALGACVSGSGPTLFAIARDGDHALQIRDRVRGEFDRVEVVPSARTAFKRL